MTEFSDWEIFRNLLLAARWTVVLSVIAFLSGGLVGLFIMTLRTSGLGPARWLAWGYIELFQGTPLLMQLFLAFFGLGLLGFEVSAWSAAVVALTLFTSAFLAEIWRGCVEAIPRGQWEAAESLGMGFIENLRYVIAPQAIRIAIPPTAGFSVQVVKGTALTSIIGFVELTKASTMLNNATFEPFTVFAMAAAIYFAICYPLSVYARHMERKLNVTRNA